MFSPDNQYIPARTYSLLLLLSFVILILAGCFSTSLSKSELSNPNQPKSPLPLKAKTNSPPPPKISVQAGIKADLTTEPNITPMTSPTPITLAARSQIEQNEINPNCDPNYSGCVPIASDVDCAGGKGNGPAYVSGPLKVIGSDIYDLDRDNDGIACE